MFCLIIALCMIMAIVTACGEKSEEGTTTAVSKQKLTLKFLCYSRSDFQYSNDMPVFQELEKKTNVHLEWQLLPVTDAGTKFNLIMASNELPDIISYGDGNLLNKFGMEGAFIPLDDLINKNAPNIKKAMTNPPFPIPHIKAEMKATDGKIYALPFITETHTGEIFCIRKDWLDKLNLKVPETTEELYDVLKAFKEKDPNGNGKADEVPFCPDSGIYDVTTLMNSFGAHENYYVAKDNKIKYGPIEENYKEGLGFVNKLFKDGLLDKEFLSMNREQFLKKVSTNTVGMFYAWPFSGLGACNNEISKLDPNYKYISMLPVKGPHGDRYKERPQNMILPRTVITKSNKYQKETIKYFDYLYSEEGIRLMNWGIEGRDYTLVDGKPQFTDFILKNPDGKDVASIRALEGMQMALPTVATMEPEMAAVADKEVPRAWKTYDDAKVLAPNFPRLPLNEDQKAKANNKSTEIDTYVSENISKFMIGEKPLDEFSNFADQIKKMGIDDVLNIYNDSYKKYLEFDK